MTFDLGMKMRRYGQMLTFFTDKYNSGKADPYLSFLLRQATPRKKKKTDYKITINFPMLKLN